MTDYLIIDPSNELHKESLKNDLNDLKSCLSRISKAIKDAYDELDTYNTGELEKISINLKNIAARAVEDSKADLTKVDEFTNSINKLKKDIDNLTLEIIAAAVAAGVAVTLGIVAVALAGPFGMITWIVLAPVVAGAIYIITIDSLKIKADQEEIKQIYSKIDIVNYDMAILKTITQTFSDMVVKLVDVKSNMSEMLKQWQILKTDAENSLNDITKALKDEDTPDYNAIKTDLNAASEEWTKVNNQAKSLAMNIKMSDAKLTVGMSQDQVKNALDASGVSEICNKYSVAKKALKNLSAT